MQDSPAGNSSKHGNETRTLNQLLSAGMLQPGNQLRVPMERGLTSVKGTVTASVRLWHIVHSFTHTKI